MHQPQQESRQYNDIIIIPHCVHPLQDRHSPLSRKRPGLQDVHCKCPPPVHVRQVSSHSTHCCRSAKKPGVHMLVHTPCWTRAGHAAMHSVPFKKGRRAKGHAVHCTTNTA